MLRFAVLMVPKLENHQFDNRFWINTRQFSFFFKFENTKPKIILAKNSIFINRIPFHTHKDIKRTFCHSTPSWTLRELSSSVQAYTHTSEDCLQYKMSFHQLRSLQTNEISQLDNELLSFKEECWVHAWYIDSECKNCSIEEIKREVPFVWHPYTILFRFLQVPQFVQWTHS